VTLDSETPSDAGPVDDEAVRVALEQIDAVRIGDDARRARKASDAEAQAPAPGYQAPVPVATAPAYRAPTPVSTPFGDRPIGEILGLQSPDIPSASDAGAPLPQPPRDMRSIEDIYTRFHDIGQGATFIRVDRIEPKMHGTTPTAGILGDLREQISTTAFAQRFGGGSYNLLIIGPPRDRHRRPIEGAPLKTLAEFRIRIPGVPQIAPSEGNDMTQSYGRGYPPPFAYGMSPEVEIRRMELDRERDRELREASRSEPAIYQTLTEQQREVVKVIERHANERSVGLEALIKDANARIRDLELRERELLEQKVALQREVSEARNMTETQQIREVKDRYELQLREAKESRERENKELRDRHETEMKHRMDEYVREKDRLVTDHRMAFEAESRRHAEERQKLVEDVRNERDRTREQTADQIAIATKEHDRNVKSLVDNYEGRIRQLQESAKDRLESLERSLRDQIQNEKSSHEQERRSYEQMRLVVEKTTEASAQMRIQSLEERLARAEETNDELAAENRDLHIKLNKPPGEYISEVAGFAKDVLGMKTAEEAKSSGDEEFSITKVAAQSVKTLIEKAPEVARAIGDMRQGGMQAQQQQAAMQQAHQQQQQHALAVAQHNAMEQQRYAAWQQQQRQAQQQQQPNQRRPGENARPPQWAQPQAPVPAKAAPPASANQGGQRRKAAAPPTTGFPNVVQIASPVSERVGVTPIAQVVDAPEAVHLPPELRPPPPMPMPQGPSAPPPQAVAQGPAPQPQAPPPHPGAAPPELTVEAINEFLGDLATAIKMKVSPKFFATEFVGKITADVAKQIIGRVSAEDIISQLEVDAEKQPGLAASPIMTLEGKRYIKEVFKQTALIVSGQA
jgi:hypothetical protein